MRSHQRTLRGTRGRGRAAAAASAQGAATDNLDPLTLSRRQLALAASRVVLSLLPAAAACQQCQPVQAAALTLEDVTPAVVAAGPLSAQQTAVITVFEAAVPAVTTVFDVTLVVGSVH